jgi:two-component system chemotaxis response regulator CheY
MPEAASLRILIVDDQRAMRQLVNSSLRQLGCNTTFECADGHEAINELVRFGPQLIISDLNMPRMDGLGLLEAVRASPTHGKTAFIMLTSRGEVELVKKAVALGVNNYLVKPFALDGLKRKIEAVVGPLT